MEERVPDNNGEIELKGTEPVDGLMNELKEVIEGKQEVELSAPELQVMGSTPKLKMSTGRRVWLWTATIISVLVLILALGGIVGTWIARGAAIEVVNGLMDSVDQLAGAGREGVALVDSRVGELRGSVGEVETAVGEISQNVSDQGLVLTLLPPEKEQELVDTANRIRETADTILASIEAALDLYNTVNSIPFVNLPRPEPERIEAVQNDVAAIQETIEQLAADIQAFRENVSSQIDRVTNGVGRINTTLGEAEQSLAQIDSQLAEVQTRAQEFAGRFATIATVTAIVVTLILAWVTYALAHTAYDHWQELHT